MDLTLIASLSAACLCFGMLVFSEVGRRIGPRETRTRS